MGKNCGNDCLDQIKWWMDQQMLGLTLIGLSKPVNGLTVLKESFVFSG
jgi:hypothetical protein